MLHTRRLRSFNTEDIVALIYEPSKCHNDILMEYIIYNTCALGIVCVYYAEETRSVLFAAQLCRGKRSRKIYNFHAIELNRDALNRKSD